MTSLFFTPKNIDTSKNIAVLRSEADHQFKKIVTQEKNIKDFQSNFDLIIQRYHTDDSLLDHMANRYAQLPWWMKFSLLASTVVVSVWIGMIFNLAMFLFMTTSIFCVTISFVFESHHVTNLKRDRRLFNDIVKLEASLMESVQHIDDIEKSLALLLTSLCHTNLQQVDELEKFELNITELGNQIKKLTTIGETLDVTNHTLIDHTQKIGETFRKAKETLSTFTKSIHQSNQAVLEGTTPLCDHHQQLNVLNDSFEKHRVTLSKMIEDLGEVMDSLKIQAAATEAFNAEALEKLGCSMNQTLTMKHDTDAVILQSNRIVDEATKMLDDYESNIKNNAHGDVEYQQNIENSHAALARASRILSLMNIEPKEPGGFLNIYSTL